MDEMEKMMKRARGNVRVAGAEDEENLENVEGKKRASHKEGQREDVICPVLLGGSSSSA